MPSKLSIGRSLSYAVDKLSTRGGATLIAAYVVFQLATQVVTQSLFAEALAGLPETGQSSQLYPLALGVPMAVSAVLGLVLLVAGTVLGIVAMRALYADTDAVPSADHTRRLARTVGVTFVVSILVTIVTLIGFGFLFFPGLFLGVSLLFTSLVVAVEDAGVVESMKRSWELTSGHRLRLFGLGFVVAIIAGLVGGIVGLVGVIDPLVNALLTGAFSGVASVFGVAVLVGAYRQLVDDGANDDGADALDASAV
ncbi:hypothetical protein [Halorussus pelagicus]|uniref:hypothetical protein n=1 Tax=Halorussus pelagicus TaxID=2505977 RepID=UPI000FFC32C7|nr:hypothetical protein [Halorussus pelagicus]